MNSEPAPGRCPKCGGTIPPDAPQSLCPRCVLARAATPTEAGVKSGSRLAAPSLETVAAAFPQFEIIELIGLGGMGVVYKVRQPKLDRLVALKLLPQSFSADPAFAERFHREARFLARLSHPHIVSVFDFGFAPLPVSPSPISQTPDPTASGGFCYLLMEFVDGVNLRQAMQAGRFSATEALAIVPGICAALQYAHDQGVLHRDIKPENILLDAQGRVKIADFGIAKLVGNPGDTRTDLTLTQSGARLGTPHYMAPEQVENPSDVDHRADIYSLGVVFYELLTGELPLGRFAAPSAKTPLDARVDEIVMRALAKERELRQQSAGEVKTQCETVTANPRDPAAAAAPISAPVAIPQPAWRRALGWAGVSLGLLSLLAWFFYATLQPVTYRTMLRIRADASVAGQVESDFARFRDGRGLGIEFNRFRDTDMFELTGYGDTPGEAVRQAEEAYAAFASLPLGKGLEVIDHAVLPLRPHTPNRPMAFVFGLAGPLLFGLPGLWLLRNRRPASGSAQPLPGWVRRAAWLFLLAGGVALFPTLPSWGTDRNVLPTGVLFALTGIALLTRGPTWRVGALVANFGGASLSLWGLGALPFLASGDNLPPGWTTGDLGLIQNVYLAVFGGLLHLAGWIAGIWILCHRSVRPVFGIQLSRPGDLAPNPWPHRLLWLVIGLFALPASALVAGLLAPVLHRGPLAGLGGITAGLVPMATGAWLVWLFVRTQPTPARAKPQTEWNPWPKRAFWAITLLLVLPTLLIMLGLIFPRMAAPGRFQPQPGSPPQPGSGWTATRLDTSSAAGTGDAVVRVLEATHQERVLMLVVNSEPGFPANTMRPEFYGAAPAEGIPLPAGLTAACLLEPRRATADGTAFGGRVVAGTNLLPGPATWRLGFVLPDEHLAELAEQQVRANLLNRPFGLMPGHSTLLFSLQRTLGLDAQGRPLSETFLADLALLGTPPPETTTTRVPDLAAQELQFAQHYLAEMKKRVEVGAVAPEGKEVLDAEVAVAEAEGKLKGEPHIAAEARLKRASTQLTIAQKMREVGKATTIEVEQARLEEAKAQEELKGLETQRPAPGASKGQAGRVQFFGELNGRIDLSADHPTKLVDALLALGKPGDFADLKRVRVHRADGTTVVVNADAVMKENKREQDLELRAGDRVEIRARVFTPN